ncbi:MAG: dUTP diphosphatase [Erysipelotrichaceae bacterium]|nr:dUTP diphosphatase [Erysipelotrichaceae bacterium]
MKIKIKSLSGRMPAYETKGAAGMDIRAYLDEPVTIEAGERELIHTGLFMEIEPGYEVQLRARSGLALKQGICLANGIGTIDSDYRGEVCVILANFGREDFVVKDGDRIAQMVVMKYETAEIEASDELAETDRGSGGFGHTGV